MFSSHCQVVLSRNSSMVRAGGGYATGNASLEPAQDLVKESDYQVVVVSVQYRLALFGLC